MEIIIILLLIVFNGILAMSEIVGDIPTANQIEDQEIIKREGGTFLVDGLLPIDEFKSFIQIKKIAGEKTGAFHTVGGLMMARIGRIPVSGDSFDLNLFHLEVVDMDDNRVDKVLGSKIS